MTKIDVTDDRPETPERAPLINARSAAWVLTTAALGSLVVGMLAVKHLGRFSGKTQLQKEPEQVPLKKDPQSERPTVLPSMSAQGADRPNGLSGFDSLFPPPVGPPQNPSNAPRPRVDSAALPSPRGLQ